MSNSRRTDSMASDGFESLNRLQSAQSSQGSVIRPLISTTPHTASSISTADNAAGRQTSTCALHSSTIRYYSIQKH